MPLDHETQLIKETNKIYKRFEVFKKGFDGGYQRLDFPFLISDQIALALFRELKCRYLNSFYLFSEFTTANLKTRLSR